MDRDDDTDRYWMPATGSAKSSTRKGRSLTSTSPAVAAQHRSDWITTCALRVLGSYRKDDFANPDVFLTQLALVLERYDDKVIEVVTSPATGIQRTCKFPPSIAEVVEFIDEHIRRAGFAANYDARSRAQIEEREQFERDQREPLEYRRAVVERVMADYKSKIVPETKPQRQTWKQFSAEELLSKYPKRA